MRTKRWSVAAAATATALVLASCGSDNGGGGNSDDEEQAGGDGGGGGTVTIAEVNEFTSFNDESATGNLDMNNKVNLMTRSRFFHLDDELNIVPNEGFGSMTVESEDPLRVTYSINEGQTWSDGEPIDADDMLLAWAVQSGAFVNDAGDAAFAYAGDTSGLALTEVPEVGDDGRSVTLEYSEPYADYELVDLIDQPVHVIAEQAGTTAEEFVTALQETPKGESNETITAVGEFWTTGLDVTSLPDESLYLSSGPFIVDSWDKGQSMTLVKNEDYSGDQETSYDSVVFRFIGDANAQVTALRNGEVDIIAPQPSADTIEALEAADGVETLQGDQFSYDHLDLNIGSDVFADDNVREAFMMTVPRQQILDAIVTPINPEADVLNSQIFFPGQDGYDDSAANNGSDAYLEPDIEGARELLDGATPTVRILYNTDNPNRVDAYTLIKESAEQAGFVVEDLGSPEWSSLLEGGDYEASIFGWVSSGAGVTGVPQIFGTGSGSNFNDFSDPEADALMDELITELDRDAQIELQQQIDALIFADYYGLPLFASPGVFAHSERVQGVVYYPGQDGVVWNFWEWELA